MTIEHDGYRQPAIDTLLSSGLAFAHSTVGTNFALPRIRAPDDKRDSRSIGGQFAIMCFFRSGTSTFNSPASRIACRVLWARSSNAASRDPPYS